MGKRLRPRYAVIEMYSVIVLTILNSPRLVSAVRCTGKETVDTTCTFEIIVRDFDAGNNAKNPDFEMQNYQAGIMRGMLLDKLGATGYYGLQPRFDTSKSGQWPWQRTIKDASSFAPWYADFDRDLALPAHTFYKEITARFTAVDKVYDVGYEKFYPLTVAEGWPNEAKSDGLQMRNFAFTTEARISFTFQGGEEFVFAGDDDLWVYIGPDLVIDMGGLHAKTCQRIEFAVPAPGATTVTASINGNLRSSDPSVAVSAKGSCKPSQHHGYKELQTTKTLPLVKGIQEYASRTRMITWSRNKGRQ